MAMTDAPGEERVGEIAKRMRDANRIDCEDGEYLITRLRAVEGERDHKNELLEDCNRDFHSLAKEREGFKALSDDYWNQLCEINHERNLFCTKLAQAEQRVAELEQIAQRMWEAECSESCGEYGNGWHAADCPRSKAEGDLYAALVPPPPGPQVTKEE